MTAVAAFDAYQEDVGAVEEFATLVSENVADLGEFEELAMGFSFLDAEGPVEGVFLDVFDTQAVVPIRAEDIVGGGEIFVDLVAQFAREAQ